MARCAVFDLDGVLFDVSKRLELCLAEAGAESVDSMPRGRKSLFWDCFLSDRYMHLDVPNKELVEYVKSLKSQGYKIVIVTGRRADTQRHYTIKQLREAGIPYDEIFFRPAKSYKKDYELKAEIIKRLIQSGCEVAEVWDDNKDVVEAIKAILPHAKVVQYRIGL